MSPVNRIIQTATHDELESLFSNYNKYPPKKITVLAEGLHTDIDDLMIYDPTNHDRIAVKPYHLPSCIIQNVKKVAEALKNVVGYEIITVDSKERENHYLKNGMDSIEIIKLKGHANSSIVGLAHGTFTRQSFYKPHEAFLAISYPPSLCEIIINDEREEEWYRSIVFHEILHAFGIQDLSRIDTPLTRKLNIACARGKEDGGSIMFYGGSLGNPPNCYRAQLSMEAGKIKVPALDQRLIRMIPERHDDKLMSLSCHPHTHIISKKILYNNTQSCQLLFDINKTCTFSHIHCAPDWKHTFISALSISKTGTCSQRLWNLKYQLCDKKSLHQTPTTKRPDHTSKTEPQTGNINGAPIICHQGDTVNRFKLNLDSLNKHTCKTVRMLCDCNYVDIFYADKWKRLIGKEIIGTTCKDKLNHIKKKSYPTNPNPTNKIPVPTNPNPTNKIPVPTNLNSTNLIRIVCFPNKNNHPHEIDINKNNPTCETIDRLCKRIMMYTYCHDEWKSLDPEKMDNGDCKKRINHIVQVCNALPIENTMTGNAYLVDGIKDSIVFSSSYLLLKAGSTKLLNTDYANYPFEKLRIKKTETKVKTIANLIGTAPVIYSIVGKSYPELAYLTTRSTCEQIYILFKNKIPEKFKFNSHVISDMSIILISSFAAGVGKALSEKEINEGLHEEATQYIINSALYSIGSMIGSIVVSGVFSFAKNVYHFHSRKINDDQSYRNGFKLGFSDVHANQTQDLELGTRSLLPNHDETIDPLVLPDTELTTDTVLQTGQDQPENVPIIEPESMFARWYTWLWGGI